jgi:prolyl oligopeptidase
MLRILVVLVTLACLAADSSAAIAQPTDSSPSPTVSPATALSPSPASSDMADPFLWLEDQRGARALAWVEAENAKTLGVLESDPRYAGLYADALTIVQAQDRIPFPRFLQNQIYNFWQDADHARGIWRRTTFAGYTSPSPHWTTVLDLDALATAEKANWVWQGADCYWPDERRCLISLSDGGEDARTVREFDLTTQRFVAAGFVLPHGKQDTAWESSDALLVAREWVPGEITTSGYPYVVKRLARGQPLSAAVEIFRGTKSDVGASPLALHDGQGHHVVMVVRNMTFFTSEYYLVTPAGVRKLDVPLKADVSALVAGRLLFTLKQDWNTGKEATFRQGSLVSLDLAQVMADPQHLKPTLVYAPGPRATLDGVDATRAHLLITTYEDVKGRAYVYTPTANGGWSHRRLALPDNSSISLDAADQRDERAFLDVESFLVSTSLWLANTSSGSLAVVKALPAKFDASKDVVEQHEATSKDGTQIPYFIVHPKSMKLDGSNPTILYAYGGFQISETPAYSATIGKLWLERGGVYVLANIRGGGEFGPAWHDAGLTVHRQRIYDDFAAVAQDLIAKKITSPRRLGIQGGSNGGLLMGVEFTQHPELWNAVDIQVPLLDMLRYEKIDAGASWVGEYGSVSNPEQRAFLASISPYNNIKAGVDYPQPLIWTTTKDDRVGPQHARKFAARLQAMGIPYYFYEVVEGGHAAGANLKERAHTIALEITYFTRKLMDQ